MTSIDLNSLRPKDAGTFGWDEVVRSTRAGQVTVHFGDVLGAAEAFISGSDAVVGCVAWVKSHRVIAALAARPVALVVNKEYGLRIQGHRDREPLLQLTGGIPANVLPAPAKRRGRLEPVRCAGFTARGKFVSLMHHKFLVRLTDGEPTAVWTGSINLTNGAARNLENGVEIRNRTIAAAYLAEFARVWAISEPLLFAAGPPKPGDQKGGELRIPAPKPPKKRKRVTKRKPRQ